MHLAVDDAGQNMQALAVDPFACRSAAERADLGDAPVADADIADALAVLVDHDAIHKNEIEELRRHAVPCARIGSA